MRLKGKRMRMLGLLFALLLNAIPLYGVKVHGWSASTVVVLYWFENLAVAVFTCLRIALHRKLTRKRGHWRAGALGAQANGQPIKAGLLGEYAVIAFVFTLVHGIFVGAFVAIAASNHPNQPIWQFSRAEFLQGAQLMLLVMAAEFVVDAILMRGRSFAWLKGYVGQRMGRVLVMHLTIIVGMGAMMATESPFAVLYVLIGLKTLWDLLASNASARPSELPAKPPRWLGAVADKLGKDAGGAEEMARDWARNRESMISAAREDEEVMPA